MLPPIIAIFDTRITDCDDPMTLHRYALVSVQPNGDSYILSALPQVREDAKLVDTMDATHPGSISINVYPSRDIFKTMIWSTHFKLEVDGREYLIVDFGHRIFDHWVYSIKLRGDTVMDCRNRQIQQSRLRAEKLSIPIAWAPTTPRAARVPSVRPVRETSQKLPAFVAHLIKEKAISSEDLCPIARTPFTKDCPATLLSCFHLFDQESIEQWIAIKNECPTCKATIVSTTVI